eukprot:CAMPEP_0177722952 /NCGR_PEP_ID=MMETSP0484_2-20121128/17953_1 /TAXON_ID=354590 /ORGANISM="Rhodomonas lens, Strain RHODO" /LENGTH=118 /DNA_ID=CAMNT_0019235355 /DNA_START=106 /DNA_END=463 /DNA_ORIENTATION=+
MSSDALRDFELAVHDILGRIKEQTLNEQEKYEEILKAITRAIKFACKREGSTVYHRVAVMDLCAGYKKMSEANKKRCSVGTLSRQTSRCAAIARSCEQHNVAALIGSLELVPFVVSVQ